MNTVADYARNEFRVVRAKIFTCDTPKAPNKLMRSYTGTITVYDDVAGYYTSCHTKSQAQLEKIWEKGESVSG